MHEILKSLVDEQEEKIPKKFNQIPGYVGAEGKSHDYKYGRQYFYRIDVDPIHFKTALIWLKRNGYHPGVYNSDHSGVQVSRKRIFILKFIKAIWCENSDLVETYGSIFMINLVPVVFSILSIPAFIIIPLFLSSAILSTFISKRYTDDQTSKSIRTAIKHYDKEKERKFRLDVLSMGL